MSGLDANQNDPTQEKKDYVGFVVTLMKKSFRQLWAMTPWGDPADVAYYMGMDESETGKEELKRIKGMSVGCSVYGVILGFFLTMWFTHVSASILHGAAPVIGTVLNAVLMLLWLFAQGLLLAFAYFVLKWTIVKKMGKDGLEYLQVAITYSVLCVLVFSILAFLLPFNIYGS